jgi:precorrin-6A/cobalt-precorrin-6A reductase
MASATKTRLLILGGTTEAYVLADSLVANAGVQVFNSLAGRTTNPRLPAGDTRIGGFGGVAGLARYLTAQRIDAVVDATHAFASRMGWNAASACASTGTPLLRLERPAWAPEPGDHWESVEHWDQAVLTLRRLGAKRVFLAVGRQEVAPFAVLRDTWLLVRAVSPPDPMPEFARAELLLARGPFDLPSERALLQTYAIDSIVCKNSGGDATGAKLVAARELGVPVVMRKRPRRPVVDSAPTVEAALGWISGLGDCVQCPPETRPAGPN